MKCPECKKYTYSSDLGPYCPHCGKKYFGGNEEKHIKFNSGIREQKNTVRGIIKKQIKNIDEVEIELWDDFKYHDNQDDIKDEFRHDVIKIIRHYKKILRNIGREQEGVANYKTKKKIKEMKEDIDEMIKRWGQG